MDNEEEGKNYHLQRFLNDTCTSLNKKSSSKDKKSKKNKKKQIKLPVLDNNRGIFENVLVGKTFCRASYSPLQKARMNEDIYSLAKNRSDEVEIYNAEKNDAGIQDTEPVVEQVQAECLFNKEGSIKSNCPPKNLEENGFKTPERNKSVSPLIFQDYNFKNAEPNDRTECPKFFEENGIKEPKSDNPMNNFFIDLTSKPSSSKRQKLTNNFRNYRSQSVSSESDSEPNLFTKKIDLYKDIEYPHHRVKKESPEKISKLSFFDNYFEHKMKQKQLKRKRENRLSPHTY